MADILRIATTSGADTVLDEATAQGFKSRVRDPLLRPGDAGYDEARTIWNAMIDRKPALIARCAGAADVITAVNFARDHRLLFSVRVGGHNVAGFAVCNGSLMSATADGWRKGKRSSEDAIVTCAHHITGSNCGTLLVY